MNLKDLRRKSLSTLVLSMLSLVAFAQNLAVTGVVTDDFGDPMIGVNVTVKGTTNGAITDFDGNYSLQNVGAKDVLVFSYIGYTPQEIKVDNRTKIDTQMKEDQTALEEVVVVGYGVMKKKDLTGAVTSVKAKDIAAVPVSSASEALTGKMAGVNVSTTEGSPDADVKIRVRGGGSLSQDNSPLYIVDGFPVNSISDIAPSEIESIDVLKDASSTAIYGAQGANGVVIVTTKGGKEGKVEVAFNASLGWKNITKELNVLNPYEYARYQYELNSNGNNPTNVNTMANNYGMWQDLDIWRSVEGSDFQDEVFGRTGMQQMYNANVSGGSKEMQYNISYAHNEETSIMEKSGYRKDNINAKFKLNISQWVTLDFNARLANQVIDGLNGGADTNESNAANSIVYNSLIYAPISELVSADEDEESSMGTRRSPSERLQNTYKVQKRLRQDYNGSLTWKPMKGLTFKSEFGYNWRYNNTDQVWAARAVSNSTYGYNGMPQAYLARTTYEGWRNANTVTYDTKLFGKRDRINVLLGQEWSQTKQKDLVNVSVAYPESFRTDEVLANLAAGTALPSSSKIYADDNMLSFFGRVNYTMMEKYLLTFTLREDGSSKFGDGNRWGLFPSLALAWRLSDEEFMQRYSTWLSNLKVRLSYGTAGNNRIPAGMLATTYSMASADGKHPGFNETSGAMLEHATTLYNPNLKWETTTTRNLGIDYGFIDGRLSGSFDLYWNTTKDLLLRKTIPSGSGYTQQYQNFGQTSNTGAELSLNAVIVDNKRFSLNFNFNIAYNKNKIDELAGNDIYQTSNWGGSRINKGSGDYFLEEGGRLGEVWGYKSNGYYTAYDAEKNPNGELVLNSKNVWVLRDGVTDNSSNLFGGLYPGTAKVEVDAEGNPIYQRLGNTVPTTTGGFGFDGSVKNKWGNIDFNVFLNYSLGNEIVNGTRLASSFFAGSSKNYNVMADWKLANRYTWVDPETGLNLGRPSASTIEYYGGAEGIASRLCDMNTGKTAWNPAANSAMVLVSDALEDASFLRLQNVTVGYTLPKMWLMKMHMQTVRFYFTGYNLLCFTNYSGYDPEVDTSSKSNPMTPGVDFAAYPKSRSYVAGVNITF